MKNYFEIFSAADKEMIHSAMLKEMLERDQFFAKKLFPAARLPPKVRIETEKRLGVRGLRADLLATDENGEKLLLVENKFKSFPAPEQLKNYAEAAPAAVKYLLIFNNSALGDISRVENWHILAYRDVVDAIREYLELENRGEEKWRLLLREYLEFLEGYIRKYDQAIARPSILDEWEKESEEEKHEAKFYRRLFLGNLADRLREARPDFIINADAAGAIEPLLNIYPPDWNKIPYKDSVDPKRKEPWPKIFIQLQGKKIKFYLRWREAGSSKKKNLEPKIARAIIDYINRLDGLEGVDARRIESRMASWNASCEICDRPFILTDNIEDSVNQVLEFYNHIDKAVRKCGMFHCG